jgi:type IV secretory pathway TraG/TraD family ATPase VirD4
MLRLLMQSVLPDIGDGGDVRALVYDAKQDALPILSAICPEAQIRTTNPFDARGVAWDLCRDIREPRVAIEIAFTLIPQEHESQPYFANAARHLLYGVMVSYMRSGLEWCFADLLRGLESPDRLRAILMRHPQTHSIVHRYFHDERVLADIMSTVATKMLPFESIAACWEQAEEKISLQQWVLGSSILVLGNSEVSRTAIDAINRCMFKRASDITLGQSESFERRSWFVLDELSEAGRLDGLVSLLKKGRSKGACVATSFQTISGLRDARLYGPHLTDEIVGQIGNRFFGRLECPETAEWSSRSFGEQEIDRTSPTHTSSQQGSSSSTNRQVVTQRALLPSQFMNIPPCTRRNGLTGYFMVRDAGCFSANFTPEVLFDEALLPAATDVADFEPRDIEAQYLRPWTPAEARAFGAEPEADSSRPTNQSSPDLLHGLDDLDEEFD